VNPTVELNLALLLFLPWYLLLGWLFWRLRARGGAPARKLAAFAFLVVALVAAAFAGIWALKHADPSAGAIWKQVLACVVGYGAFLGVLVAGSAVLRTPRRTARD
jgi:hypothetical protein